MYFHLQLDFDLKNRKRHCILQHSSCLSQFFCCLIVFSTFQFLKMHTVTNLRRQLINFSANNWSMLPCHHRINWTKCQIYTSSYGLLCMHFTWVISHVYRECVVSVYRMNTLREVNIALILYHWRKSNQTSVLLVLTVNLNENENRISVNFM